MCCQDDQKKGCQKPENLKGTPEECTPEQIRECHGDIKEHACLPQEDPGQPDEDDN